LTLKTVPEIQNSVYINIKSSRKYQRLQEASLTNCTFRYNKHNTYCYRVCCWINL